MENDRKLAALRELMKERSIDIYVIPTSDFHNTEFVGEYFKGRKYMSGFSGSDGTLVVTLSKSALWVDGRYFLQAAKQLEGSEIERMPIGEKGVPTIKEYISENLPKDGVIGFDGQVTDTMTAREFIKLAYEKNGSVYTCEDLVDLIWHDRPPLPKEKAWLLNDEQAGESRRNKLKRIRAYMNEKSLDMLLVSSLDDVAWLANMRGNDIKCFPVVMAYMVVTDKEAYIFADKIKFTSDVRNTLEKDGIKLKDYEDIYEYVKHAENMNIAAEASVLNYAVYENIAKSAKVTDDKLPIKLWKACKNEKEIENTKKAHIKDGIAVTKFIYHIKNKVEKGIMHINENDAASILLGLRQEQKGFIEPSFETIAAYGENAAFVHYDPNIGKTSDIRAKGFLLVDSGGHYIDGTTDITRTIVLGELSAEQKRNFTAVLKGMIRLSMQKFVKGCTGSNLDVICRGVLWNLNLDYKHGTGHGVGHILAVHEAPNAFRWKIPKDDLPVPLCEGMITSNEPGFYKEGEYGIRIENELLVRADIANEYGQFMEFETLTLAPIDKEAIEIKLLDDEEINWLNEYHKKVYDTLKDFMNDEERKWLAEATCEIGKDIKR